MREALTVVVQEVTQIAAARRAVVGMAQKLGFDDTEVGKAAIVVTEAATNLVKHAHGGQVLLQPLANHEGPGIDVLALDKGPGMVDLAASLSDGYSTAGSPGTGLGAMARLSSLFDVYSRPGAGTAILARLWGAGGAQPKWRGRYLEVGALCVPKPGETVSGDAWAVVHNNGGALLTVADGLGHGPDAAAAAQGATRVLLERSSLKPTLLIEAMHAALGHTRGAAVAVAEIDFARQSVCYAGVGNIAAGIASSEGLHHMVSLSGIVGQDPIKLREFSYRWPPGAVMIVHSDGLGSRWDLQGYPGLAERHPTLVAAVLYRDFHRPLDDGTVVVVRERQPVA